MPSQEDPSPQSARASLHLPQTLLVPTSALREWIGHPELVVLDCRSSEDYAAGHLPQAISFPTAWTFDSENEDKLPTVQAMEGLFGGVGVDETKTVVVYDNGSLRSAARVFWALHVHGQAATVVLEGGLEQWVAEGGEILHTPLTPRPTSFIARISAGHLATLLEVREAIDNADVRVVDVRSKNEYAGREAHWPRNGHIPGAQNIEWTLNFVTPPDSNRLHSPEALRDLYGLAPGSRAITYCTRGRRAAVSYLALRSAGVEAAVYDGSWTEWSNHAEAPVETSESVKTVSGISEE